MPDDVTGQGIAALKAGDKKRARELLAAAISANPNDEQAWLWLSGAVETDAARIDCLRRVLAINPDSAVARRGLESLGVKSEPPRIVKLVPLPQQRPEQNVLPPAPSPTSETSDNWLVTLLGGMRDLVFSFVFTSQFGAARWVVIPATLLLCACCLCPLNIRLNSPVGRTAPDFTLNNLAGYPVQLSKLRGQVVLVNFWATWCGPCRAELPDMAAVYQAHQAEGFVILGVNNQENAETLSRFLASNTIPYPILLDSNARVTQAYRVSAFPTTFVIDRRGMVRTVMTGSRDYAELEEAIKPLLAEKPE
jgi:cytochrome c biogenesis protein CcmG/thiol:disulfide interchange protein DsbE